MFLFLFFFSQNHKIVYQGDEPRKRQTKTDIFQQAKVMQTHSKLMDRIILVII